ncbi:MAG: DUF1992 domain-containing protein [Acidimicrobiia bacterium]|nr:DUF1992 domain-containing protein [Acidimicrobiia bacterium]
MGIFESIAERRIRQARKAGFFDNLQGAGKPIPDLDWERPPGWWAARLVKQERSMMRAEDLDGEIRAARPGFWRAGSEDELLAQVDELNKRVDEYNHTTTWEPRDRQDRDQIVDQWRRLRSPSERRRTDRHH